MMAPEIWPRSLSGEVLTGESAVRYVFVDEAGTSETEPVTVVVGIIAHADHHVMMAEALLNEMLGAVPAQFRDGFIFHATEVWNKKEWRDDWRMTDRLALMEGVMSIPRRLNMAIAMCMIRNNSANADNERAFAGRLGITLEQFQHSLAFGNCLARADKYIRDYGDASEVATVVAENVENMKGILALTPRMFQHKEMLSGSMDASRKDRLLASLRDKSQGYINQEADLRITRIRKTIHFVAKDEDPLVQLADACAFGYRRFFSQIEHGDRFCRAIIGGVLPIEDWMGGLSAGVHFFHPPRDRLNHPYFTLT